MQKAIKLTQAQAIILDDAITHNATSEYHIEFGRFAVSMSTINSMVKKGIIKIKSKSYSPNICKIQVTSGVSLHGGCARIGCLRVGCA